MCVRVGCFSYYVEYVCRSVFNHFQLSQLLAKGCRLLQGRRESRYTTLYFTEMHSDPKRGYIYAALVHTPMSNSWRFGRKDGRGPYAVCAREEACMYCLYILYQSRLMAWGILFSQMTNSVELFSSHNNWEGWDQVVEGYNTLWSAIFVWKVCISVLKNYVVVFVNVKRKLFGLATVRLLMGFLAKRGTCYAPRKSARESFLMWNNDATTRDRSQEVFSLSVSFDG